MGLMPTSPHSPRSSSFTRDSSGFSSSSNAGQGSKSSMKNNSHTQKLRAGLLFKNLVWDEVSRSFFKDKLLRWRRQRGRNQRNDSLSSAKMWRARRTARESRFPGAEPALCSLCLEARWGMGLRKATLFRARGKIFGCTWPWLCPLGLKYGGLLWEF